MQIKSITQIEYLQLSRTIHLIVPAQGARLGPPVGPILGQAKIKVKDFCTLFNDVTKNYTPGFPLKVVVYVYKNENFHFYIKPPSISFLIKNYLKFKKQSSLSLLDVYKLTCIKKQEFENSSDKIIFRNLLSIIKVLKIKIN